jgi:endonuclease/exonuclease/phosphatase family metal-dependent hydrolase
MHIAGFVKFHTHSHPHIHPCPYQVDYHAKLEAHFSKRFHILHSYHDNTLWQPHGDKRHGNTVLIRRELVNGPITSQSVKLSDDGNVGLIVRCHIGAVPVTIATVHLECEENPELTSGTKYSIRRHSQSKCLLSHIPNTDVVILGGDFNAPVSPAVIVCCSVDYFTSTKGL